MAREMPGSRVRGSGAANTKPSPPVPGGRLFNPFELRLFRYTAVLASLVALAALIGIIVWSLSWFLSAFYNLLLALALSGALALVLYPMVQFFENRLRLPRLAAVVFPLLIFTLSIGSLIYFLVPLLADQIVRLMTILPETIAGWQRQLSIHFPQLSAMISSSMENGGGEDSKSVLKTPGTTIMSYMGTLAALSFVPLFLFFTLLSGDLLRAQASELLSIFHNQTQQKVLYFMDVFVEYVTAFFQGQLIIAVCMGALYAAGFSLLGLKFGVLTGLVLGLLNIIPFLGTLIGLLVILPMSFLQDGGGIHLLLLTGVVFAVVQLIESWLLTPKIMADRSGLHPALVVVSLFFWGTAFGGVIGMVLAVPLTAFFVAIWSEIKGSLKHALSGRDSRAKGG